MRAWFSVVLMIVIGILVLRLYTGPAAKRGTPQPTSPMQQNYEYVAESREPQRCPVMAPVGPATPVAEPVVRTEVAQDVGLPPECAMLMTGLEKLGITRDVDGALWEVERLQKIEARSEKITTSEPGALALATLKRRQSELAAGFAEREYARRKEANELSSPGPQMLFHRHVTVGPSPHHVTVWWPADEGNLGWYFEIPKGDELNAKLGEYEIAISFLAGLDEPPYLEAWQTDR